MTADLALICHKCQFPVNGDSGYLRVLYADIHKHRDQERAYRQLHPEGEAVSIEDFLLGPEDIHWRAYHAACDPEIDQPCYAIDAERIQTWAQLCHWTAHLMEKTWFPATDWDCLLEQAAGDAEPTTLRVLARAS